MLSYYQILLIDKTATQADIKRAYRKLSKILHPDLNNNTIEANTMFRLLHSAYETLSDETKRKAYDTGNVGSDVNSTNDLLSTIASQNKMLKDYKQIVQLKSKREKELLKELKGLKDIINLGSGVNSTSDLLSKISSQNRMITDYKQIIDRKNKREKELLKELEALQWKGETQKEEFSEESSQNEIHINETPKVKSKKRVDWDTIFIVMAILIGLGLIILAIAFPVAFWFFVILGFLIGKIIQFLFFS